MGKDLFVFDKLSEYGLNGCHETHMPTVLRVGRFRFFFFSNEGNEPAHIHVKAGGDEAKFWLNPVKLAANYGFNTREVNSIRKLVEEYQGELLEAWNENFNK